MISLESVTKVYPTGRKAVEDLSLEIAAGETFVLLGTSGGGKTTALKLINRLIEPTSGRILIAGDDIQRQDPVQLRRRIGYAVQDIGLFPHMTIAENMAVVPRLLGWTERRIETRLVELFDWMGLAPEEFRDRYPRQLSGGQRQRVGVARALAADPPLILMDEPFGALDPITRTRLQDEFAELQERLRKTVVLVTHDIFEAVRLGDRIAMLDRGRLQQVGTPAEIVENPATDFVDQFLGQHRFHLRLLTRTLRSLVDSIQPPPGPSSAEAPPEHLHLHQTIVQAFDIFKRAGRQTLPVFEGERYRGLLNRRVLIEFMVAILDEGRAEA
jgi:osmoprotectant transport system ATP-binding protein